ncbi:ferredoxin [Amycolatopsis acidicola]|uniref:Ferredoxin n=1 Tax=Amycolatopsis acidicola TaxID=2596893 RepID=A0A5N0ULH6_9PSEU|nr:ferredoxin [Amycolatopsis acidicola]KAA9150401.1 ferredoxin [Amycolatopsis acidicola]
MKVVLDAGQCEANGLCVAAAPRVFELDDEDELTVLDEHPPREEWEAVRAAVASCPKLALSFVEE